MIIKKLILKEGLDSSYDEFSEGRNLIYSESNTKGKSTYLRLLFYSLGYPIPNMRGIEFDEIETTLVFIEKNREFTLDRRADLLQLTVEGNTILYTLPSDHAAMLAYVFQYDNINTLNNLLGFMYIDQDKGWSLLNRGTVIGKIRFGVEELLAGLNNVNISQLLEERKALNLNKAKYSALLNMQELSAQVYEKNGEIFVSDIEKEYSEKISYINIKIESLKESLKEINALILQEKHFFDYIDSMQLYVRDANNAEIPVNRNTLVNAPESNEYLKAHRSVITSDIEKCKRERSFYERKLSEYSLKGSQMSFVNDDKADIMDRKIALIGNEIDQEAVAQLLKDTNESIKKVKARIKNAVKSENPYVDKIYRYVLKYAKKLGVDDKDVYKQDYIFTSDLKSLSGAKLQKIVFSFKLAFLKVIQEIMGTKLFMVLDSPRGKELDEKNTQLIMDLVREELGENQVFIASIYDFECEKKIEIKMRAIENRE